jgi:hypothetical protein
VTATPALSLRHTPQAMRSPLNPLS